MYLHVHQSNISRSELASFGRRNKKMSKLKCIWYLNFRVLYGKLAESCLINHHEAETYRKRRARLHRDL